MIRIPRRYCCPHCNAIVVQWANPSGLNFCTNCRRLFSVQHLLAPTIPPWAMGVLAVLAINLHVYA